MKKLIFLSFCAFTLFPACSFSDLFSKNDRIIEDQTPQVITAEGYIAENTKQSLLGKSYVLEEQSGKVLYLLKSDFEDLGQYANEGKVELKGTVEKTADSDIFTFHVETIQFLQTPASELSTPFSSANLDIALTLPPGWSFVEQDNTAELYAKQKSSTPLIRITKFLQTAQETTAFAEKKTQGTNISVGGKAAWRFVGADGQTDIYVPLEEDLLKISFLGNESEKAAFYDIVLSLSFLSDEPQKITEPEIDKICGGIAGFACPSGYRCELEGNYPDAAGKCVPAINPEPTKIITPETSEKLSPILTPQPASSEDDNMSDVTQSTADQDAVMTYLKKNIATLIPTADQGNNWVIAQFLFSTDNLVAMTYQNLDDISEKRKILFAYQVSDNSVTVEQKAYFTPGEESDWQLANGENLQAGKSQEIFTETGTKKTDLSEGYRLFESLQFGFHVEYPGNFYYASLGPSDGTLTTIVFSNQPANSQNQLLKLEILDGAHAQAIESDLVQLVPRDETSHFRLSASTQEWKDVLEHMAATVSVQK